MGAARFHVQSWWWYASGGAGDTGDVLFGRLGIYIGVGI